MSTSVVQPLSNTEFISGGLYPGGTGIFEDIRYKLWDYNGKQAPGSAVAVYVSFRPTDGSNEGKVEEIYWSVGPASNFIPDHTGGHLLPVAKPGHEPVKGISDQCNWSQVMSAFLKNCGLEPARLNGTDGITALKGSEVSLTRIDQKERDLPNTAAPSNAPGGQTADAKKFKATILVPTRCKYAWEKGARGNVAAPAPAQAVNGAVNSAAAPAPVANGAVDPALTNAISSALVAAGDNGVPFSELANLVTAQLTTAGIAGKARVQMMKHVKSMESIAALADPNGWTWDADSQTLFA